MAKRKRDPLAPLAYGLAAFGGLFFLLPVVALCATVFGTGSVFGLGSEGACADDTSYGDYGTDSDSFAREILKPGVSAMATAARLCVADADAAQMTWQALTGIPGFLFNAGALILAWLLIHRAVRHGAYAPQISSGLRILGWWLLIGGVAAPIAEEVANNRLLASLSTEQHSLPALGGISPAILLVGLGLLTFARIMRIGTQMQEDLEGTI
jgi:hypothetical protein